jgi:Putative mono-oxygenase ydhR
MSQNKASTYTVLQLRFKLRVPPGAFLEQSREAATIIASVEGVIWKIWVLREEDSEMGGVYLFANRETAQAYLNHPVIQEVCSNPAVVSTQSQLWDVKSSLSALTRAPLPDINPKYSEPDTLVTAGGK